MKEAQEGGAVAIVDTPERGDHRRHTGDEEPAREAQGALPVGSAAGGGATGGENDQAQAPQHQVLQVAREPSSEPRSPGAGREEAAALRTPAREGARMIAAAPGERGSASALAVNCATSLDRSAASTFSLVAAGPASTVARR
jgi:hypothetical protein